MSIIPLPALAINDIVMVNPTRITDSAVYVDIIEYGVEGIIIMAELSRKRFNTINKVVKIGSPFAACVLSVTDVPVTLSKKHVKENEATSCHEQYKQNKALSEIIKYHNTKTGESYEDTYNMYVTPINDYLYDLENDAHPCEILKDHVINRVLIDKIYSAIPIANKQGWINTLLNKYKPQMQSLQAVVKITCHESNAIQILKDMTSVVDPKIAMTAISSPYYMLLIKTLDYDAGFNALNDAVIHIENYLKLYDASFEIVKVPDHETKFEIPVDEDEQGTLVDD